VKPASVVTFALSLAAPAAAFAQTALELRGASSEYRFVDLSHAFARGPMLDLLYIGVPGMNELYAGAGYSWKPASSTTLTPIAYAVFGKENGERGLCLGALISASVSGLKLAGFAGRFFRLSGDVASYEFIDSLDLTRALGRYEIGASLGLFRQRGDAAWLFGPTLKLNDARGSFALSARFGDSHEIRLIRILTF